MVIGRKFAKSHETGSTQRWRTLLAARRPSRGIEYQRMLASAPGLTRAALARRLGVSRAAVTQALRRAPASE